MIFVLKWLLRERKAEAEALLPKQPAALLRPQHAGFFFSCLDKVIQTNSPWLNNQLGNGLFTHAVHHNVSAINYEHTTQETQSICTALKSNTITQVPPHSKLSPQQLRVTSRHWQTLLSSSSFSSCWKEPSLQPRAKWTCLFCHLQCKLQVLVKEFTSETKDG